MRLKEFEIFEAATAGATPSGNIAVVANPHVAHSKQKPKKVKPTDNALDMDVPLLSSKNPATIRRQIQEGSLYEVESGRTRLLNFGKIKKTPYLDPEYVGASANAFDELMKQRSKDSAIVNTEKSKRRTAKAAGYDAIMKGKDIGKIANTTPTPMDAGELAGTPYVPSIYYPRPDLKGKMPGKQNMPFTPRPDLKGKIPVKQNMPYTPRPEEPKIPRGFEYDPDSGKNRDPGFTDRAPRSPWGGKNLDPGFSDNVWSRRLDKELKKRLGGRKPV